MGKTALALFFSPRPFSLPLSTLYQWIYIKKHFSYFLNSFVKSLGVPLTSGFPMDYFIFHSQSLTHVQQTYHLCLSARAIKVYIGQVRNSSAFLPNGFEVPLAPLFLRGCTTFPAERSRGRRSYLYKNFFLTHGEKLFL